MYQRILIPVDGSETSECALQEAIKLAHREARLRLVYVLEEIYLLDAEGYAYIDFTSLQAAMRNTGERTLALALEQVKQAGLSAETALLEAKGERIASVIESEARHWPADLIVIGTHGRSGLNRLLLGSVAEGLVRVATVPVLLVRAE
ncbi:putative universal stress protein [Sideroxyarcus emersonii]|uniref:Universal stress protein n=1 Tax=Sideroxyarcus emersonii TaxID=2764705 RepID=A0AAN2BZD6_9PROT|nr:universal stress protein [Sideroxyarcus emersonii]BCK88104.1 putative universal stress protein [Sideroxyarcus emersonii]